ncbi:MAG: hypothetical protein N3F05_03805 [Candidatus Diapherotrites archaeon]|nr:hypothetical protein [Candidatus Diapherotrites archaeon]
MASKKQRSSSDKWKKKKWYKIKAPKEFKEIIIGETPAEKEQQLIGRTVELPISEIAAQKKQAPMLIKLRIDAVNAGNAETKLIGCRFDSGYLRRIVRRRKSKVDTILYVETADNKKMKLTTTAICASKTNKKKETEIRKLVAKEMAEEAKKETFENFMLNVVSGALAQKIFNSVKTIAQLQRVEVIKAHLIEGKNK